MKVYISGPLKVVSDREKFHRFYELLAEIVRECGYEPYLPHQRSDPVKHRNMEYRTVYKMDIASLLESDIIIAVIDEPSTGVGAEIGIALERHKKVIALYNTNSEPSRFILGLLEESPYSVIIQYSNNDECKRMLKSTIMHGTIHENLV